MAHGKVVKSIDHGTNVQLLCADERGLQSVYFEPKSFESFRRLLEKTGLELNGLQLEFNRELVNIPSLGKSCEVGAVPRKLFNILSWR